MGEFEDLAMPDEPAIPVKSGHPDASFGHTLHVRNNYYTATAPDGTERLYISTKKMVRV